MERTRSRLTTQKPLYLTVGSQKTVMITGDNEERFVLTSHEAAVACQQAIQQQGTIQVAEEWDEQYKGFLLAIHEWAEAHQGVVSAAYIAPGDRGLNVIIATKGEDYRYEFADELTDLDIQLSSRFPRCRATVVQLPEKPKDALDSFFSDSRAIQIYG